MVGRDGIGDDGGEGGGEIPIPVVGIRADLIPQLKIVVAAELRFVKSVGARGRSIFGVYMELEKKTESRGHPRLEVGPMARPRYQVASWVPPGSSSASWLLLLAHSASLTQKHYVYFPRFYFLRFLSEIDKELFLLKTASVMAVFIRI